MPKFCLDFGNQLQINLDYYWSTMDTNDERCPGKWVSSCQSCLKYLYLDEAKYTSKLFIASSYRQHLFVSTKRV